MSRTSRFIAAPLLLVALAIGLTPQSASAQGRRRGGGGGRTTVVVGGIYYPRYIYDPFWGPWGPWGPGYPGYYHGRVNQGSDLRLLVEPKNAEVFVDGYFAGIVDEFDGFFQRLTVRPGPHDISLYLDGHRTVRQRIYAAPGSTYKLRYEMEPLGAGEVAEARPEPAPDDEDDGREPPTFNQRVPPPDGRRPPMPPPPGGRGRPGPRPQDGSRGNAVRSSALSLRVQPADAEVLIDGEVWRSSGDERLVVQVTPGPHRVEIRKEGYRPFSVELNVRPDETLPLNVSLTAGGGR